MHIPTNESHACTGLALRAALPKLSFHFRGVKTSSAQGPQSCQAGTSLQAGHDYLIKGLVGVRVTEGEGGVLSELLSEFVLLEL